MELAQTTKEVLILWVRTSELNHPMYKLTKNKVCLQHVFARVYVCLNDRCDIVIYMAHVCRVHCQKVVLFHHFSNFWFTFFGL